MAVKQRLTFRPPVWATLVLVAACGLCITAGYWQLGRAAEKQRLFASFETGAAKPTLPGPVSDLDATAQRYRWISVNGRYDPDRQVLLDNILQNGEVGYAVLTPLRTADGTVMVNRGWVPADADRGRLPVITVDDRQRNISGRLDRLPRPGLRLAPPAIDAADPWPRRLLFPTAADLAAQIGYPVHDYQLLLDPAAADGYLRDWRPQVMGPDTHFGYAVQWFGFAVAMALIYLIVNTRKQASD